MRLKRSIVSVAVLLLGAIGLMAPASASAVTTPNVAPFGTQQDLVSAGGAVDAGWTISNLQPSDDNIPYARNGQLWEATATVEAVRGTVKPIVSDFNARAANGDNYRAIFTVPTDQGVNPADLTQGQKRTGKLYFDVVGEQPDSVVYRSGVEDALIWKG